MASCMRSASCIACGERSQAAVLPSISLKRNVKTVPSREAPACIYRGSTSVLGVPSSAAEGRAVQIFATMPVYLGALIFVGGFVLVAVGAGLLAHRYLPQTVLEDHNDIAGFMFAVVGVVYAVVLAFLAIATWQ